MQPFSTTDALPTLLDMLIVRQWLRIGEEVDNATLSLLVEAAADYAESYCDQALFARSYTATVSDMRKLMLRGIKPRNLTITQSTDGVTYDAYANIVTINYRGDLVFASALPACVSGTTYTLQYTAGYAGVGDDKPTLPGDLRLALLAHIATNYDQRTATVAERFSSVDKLLLAYKRFGS